MEIKQTKEYPVNLEPVPLPVSQNKGRVLPEGNERGDSNDDANEPQVVQPTLRRSSRGQVKSRRYPSDEYMTFTEGEELECYEEAISGEHKEKWA